MGATILGTVLGPMRGQSLYDFVTETRTEWQGAVVAVVAIFGILTLLALLTVFLAKRSAIWRQVVRWTFGRAVSAAATTVCFISGRLHQCSGRHLLRHYRMYRVLVRRLLPTPRGLPPRTLPSARMGYSCCKNFIPYSPRHSPRRGRKSLLTIVPRGQHSDPTNSSALNSKRNSRAARESY